MESWLWKVSLSPGDCWVAGSAIGKTFFQGLLLCPHEWSTPRLKHSCDWEEGAAHPSNMLVFAACTSHFQGLYLLILNYAAQNVNTVTWVEAGVTKAPILLPEKWEKNHWAGLLFGLPPPWCGWYQPEFRYHSALTCSVNFLDWNVRTANGVVQNRSER